MLCCVQISYGRGIVGWWMEPLDHQHGTCRTWRCYIYRHLELSCAMEEILCDCHLWICELIQQMLLEYLFHDRQWGICWGLLMDVKSLLYSCCLNMLTRVWNDLNLKSCRGDTVLMMAWEEPYWNREAVLTTNRHNSTLFMFSKGRRKYVLRLVWQRSLPVPPPYHLFRRIHFQWLSTFFAAGRIRTFSGILYTHLSYEWVTLANTDLRTLAS